MSKFVKDHFDKLLLTFVFLCLFAGYLYFRLAPLEQLLRDVVIAILTIVGVRRLQDAATNTNIEARQVDVTQNSPDAQPAVTVTAENSSEANR